MIKFISIIGLLSLTFCAMVVYDRWKRLNALQRTIWLMIIGIGGAVCVVIFNK